MSHNVVDVLLDLMRYGKFSRWVTPHMRLVILCIADLANQDGENAKPSLRTLVTATGLSRTAVCQALKAWRELKDSPITPLRRHRRSTVYDFDLSELRRWADEAREKAAAARQAASHQSAAARHSRSLGRAS